MTAPATAALTGAAGVWRLRWLAPVAVALVAAAIAMATTPPRPSAVATGQLTDLADDEAAAVTEAIGRHVGTEVDVDGETVTVRSRHESPTVAALSVNRALAEVVDEVGGTPVPASVPEVHRDASERAGTRGSVAGLVTLVLAGLAVVAAPPARRALHRRHATVPAAEPPAEAPPAEALDIEEVDVDAPDDARSDVADPATDVAEQILRHRGPTGSGVSSIVVVGGSAEDGAAAFATALASAVADRDRPVLLVEEDRTSNLLEALLDLPATETAKRPGTGDRTITCSAAGLWGPTPVTSVLARKRLAEWTRNDTVAVVHVTPGADAADDIWSRSADAVVTVEGGAPVVLRFDDRPGRAAE